MTHEELQFWFAEIESSEQKKEDRLKKRNNYPELISYYEGEYGRETYSLKDGTKHKLAVQNEYFPNINMLISEIMYQYPDIVTEPTKPTTVRPDIIDPMTGLPRVIDNEANAPILKGALTYLVKKLGALDENKLALFDMLMAGICGVEVNIVNKNPQPIPEKPGMIDRIKKLTQRRIEENISKEEPTPEEIYAKETKTYIRRWSPLDFGFDYTVNRVGDAKYVYKIIKKTYAEAVAEYPEIEGHVAGGESIAYSTHSHDANKKTVTFYEVQHRKKDNVYETFLLCKGYKYRELYRYDRPYQMNGFNLKIGMLDDYGVDFPISRAQLNKTVQDDINNYLTHKMEVAERNIPKRWYNKNKVLDTPEGLQALNSNKTMDNVGVDGGGEHIGIVPMASASNDNNELLMVFERTKEKLWGVSGQRLQVGTKPEFAEELKIQEAGFQSRQVTIQQGLRKIMVAQVDTLKDIIAQLWDDSMWFKITGGSKPTWYQPEFAADGTILNPLSEILSLDYEVDIDIVSALRPNKEFRKKETVEFLTWLINIAYPAVIMPQGYIINVDEIKEVARDYGFSPDNLIKPLEEIQGGLGAEQIQQAGPPQEGVAPEAVPVG